ncbi:MAG: hypothetical protein HZA66_02570 [Rhodopseudomonas palustris]|uniref:Uncharacterized protein n=1 Tax=Rhodopseudomonas palustris TaxID=1076 RepID=A0A933VU42_RHOPL|nr:hypothetical protein [Rhodopseudomonas palustris]
MRRMISGLAAAIAVVTVSAAPASACGGGLFAGACAPCGAVSACGSAVVPYDYGYSAGYGAAAFERLPDPTRYYYVNQGPTYTGPGNFAPAPYYDDRTISVWRTGSAYSGGVYADAMTHRYVGAPAMGPVVYSYGHRHRHVRHHHRYGMPHGAFHRGHYGAPRYAYGPRTHYRHHAPLRRYY